MTSAWLQLGHAGGSPNSSLGGRVGEGDGKTPPANDRNEDIEKHCAKWRDHVKLEAEDQPGPEGRGKKPTGTDEGSCTRGGPAGGKGRDYQGCRLKDRKKLQKNGPTSWRTNKPGCYLGKWLRKRTGSPSIHIRRDNLNRHGSPIRKKTS